MLTIRLTSKVGVRGVSAVRCSIKSVPGRPLDSHLFCSIKLIFLLMDVVPLGQRKHRREDKSNWVGAVINGCDTRNGVISTCQKG